MRVGCRLLHLSEPYTMYTKGLCRVVIIRALIGKLKLAFHNGQVQVVPPPCFCSFSSDWWLMNTTQLHWGTDQPSSGITTWRTVLPHWPRPGQWGGCGRWPRASWAPLYASGRSCGLERGRQRPGPGHTSPPSTWEEKQRTDLYGLSKRGGVILLWDYGLNVCENKML